MMKISDAVDILHDLALEMGDPPDDTCITNPDEDNIEAINLAIGILSVLDANKLRQRPLQRLCISAGPRKLVARPSVRTATLATNASRVSSLTLSAS